MLFFLISGKFPPELGRAWDRYKKEWEGKDEDKAMNDDPREYGNDAEQIWVLLAFELCGTELEDMKVSNCDYEYFYPKHFFFARLCYFSFLSLE